jgi:hypothetical protein
MYPAAPLDENDWIPEIDEKAREMAGERGLDRVVFFHQFDSDGPHNENKLLA